jgi:hypothetical protein
MNHVPDASSNFDDDLWLPKRPSDKEVELLADALLPRFIEELRRNAHAFTLELLAHVESDDIFLEMVEIDPIVENWKKTKKQWHDSYTQPHDCGKPLFEIEAYLEPGHVRSATEFSATFARICAPSILAAELITSLPTIDLRTTAADLMVADYVKDNDYLEDTLEDMTENNDTLEYGDDNDNDSRLTLEAIFEFRKKIIEGTFGLTHLPIRTAMKHP